jgi:hypothetical protein
MASRQVRSARYALAVELADRGASSLLSRHDWILVSNELGQVRDQLQEDLPNEAELRAVFGDFVAELVERLGNPEIGSLEQARVYAQSGDKQHRSQAAGWLDRRRQ